MQRRPHHLHLFEARNNRPMVMLQRRRPKAFIALSTVIVGNANPPTTAPCVGTSMEPISSKSRKIWLDHDRPLQQRAGMEAGTHRRARALRRKRSRAEASPLRLSAGTRAKRHRTQDRSHTTGHAGPANLALTNDRSPRLRTRRLDCLARSSQACADLSMCALSAAEAARWASSANSTAFLLYCSSLVMGGRVAKKG